MTAPVSASALREMVREILTEVIAEEIEGRIGSLDSAMISRAQDRERVTISSQADLDRAIRRVVEVAQDPAGRAAIERGDISFVLGSTPADAAVTSAAVHRVDKGAVTERHVRAAAEAGAVIVTARRVVITPLARDRSRSLGVVIRKDS
jgi:hypothetical protein